jgi:putative Holliday junction resolvase
MSRVLAVDFGERRIGLALSDPTATLAQPFGVLERRAGKRPPLLKLIAIIEENDVDRVVVGLPLALDASDTEWTGTVREFAAKLAARSGRPVSLIDERLTSVMAERAVRSLGLPRHEREKKERVDAAAATIILQTFLDREKLGIEEERATPDLSESAEATNGAG